jgi:hypothetical protein
MVHRPSDFVYFKNWITHVLVSKENPSKHINIRCNFEDIAATSPAMKIDSKLDKHFEQRNILIFWILHLTRMTLGAIFTLGMRKCPTQPIYIVGYIPRQNSG